MSVLSCLHQSNPLPCLSCHCSAIVNHPSKFTETLVAEYTKQILETLVYLHHQKGITHRDIKPENILLTTHDLPNARLKLSDFGFGKFFGMMEVRGPISLTVGCCINKLPRSKACSHSRMHDQCAVHLPSSCRWATSLLQARFLKYRQPLAPLPYTPTVPHTNSPATLNTHGTTSRITLIMVFCLQDSFEILWGT